MHATGEYTIADLMEVFSMGRATVYRVLDRARPRGPGGIVTPRGRGRHHGRDRVNGRFLEAPRRHLLLVAVPGCTFGQHGDLRTSLSC